MEGTESACHEDDDEHDPTRGGFRRLDARSWRRGEQREGKQVEGRPGDCLGRGVDGNDRAQGVVGIVASELRLARLPLVPSPPRPRRIDHSRQRNPQHAPYSVLIGPKHPVLQIAAMGGRRSCFAAASFLQRAKRAVIRGSTAHAMSFGQAGRAQVFALFSRSKFAKLNMLSLEAFPTSPPVDLHQGAHLMPKVGSRHAASVQVAAHFWAHDAPEGGPEAWDAHLGVSFMFLEG